MKPTTTTEAWRYCDAGKLADPATVQTLVQAALKAAGHPAGDD